MVLTQKRLGVYYDALAENAQAPLKAELRHCQEAGVYLSQVLASFAGYHIGDCKMDDEIAAESLTTEQLEQIRGAIRSLATGPDLSVSNIAQCLVCFTCSGSLFLNF